MQITVRPAEKQDAEQMLQVYNSFTAQFVGLASREIKTFKRMLQNKDNVNVVALSSQKRIVGYVHARLNKRLNRGEFREIVVDSKQDFEHVAKKLVEKVHADFMERKVAAISASSIRNPAFEKLFPALGFLESETAFGFFVSETNDVFMYAILTMQKFLNEISQVFAIRLKQLRDWKGVMQIECEGHSLFLNKAEESVEAIVWTNQPVDFKVRLDRTVLAKLVFGVADPIECLKTGQIEVEPTRSKMKVEDVLRGLFPEMHFLIMDYW